MTDAAYPDALPVGHRLHWYVLETVLGQGGFGITYLAHDTNLDRRVAIKEYLPTEIARRRADASARPRSDAQAERYAWGLERFLSEARTLARFDHPNIVRVHTVFEANNTAYMVMRFEEGEDLATLLDRCGTLPEDRLAGCLLPVLDGLQLVHAAGFIHRDIKPENIYVRRDGSPVLLDFGSARQSFGSAKTMTILVAPGYAPLEQYYGDAATQGAWTDIYGLGATCYRAIGGRAPLDAIARAKGVLGSAREVLQPAIEMGQGRYSQRLLAAVDHALQLSERDRPQSVADWRRELVAAPLPLPAMAVDAAVAPAPAAAPTTVAVAAAAPAVLASLGAAAQAQPPASRRGLVVAAVAAALGAATVLVYVAASRAPAPPALAQAAAPVAAPAATVAAAPAPASVQHNDEPLPAKLQRPAMTTAALTPSPRTAPVREPKLLSTAMPAVPRAMPNAEPRSVVPPVVSPTQASVPIAVVTVAPAAPTPSLAALQAQVAAADKPASRPAGAAQLDAAEAALKRGDAATAAQLLAPWAAAGVPRAQALLGRAQEAGTGRQQNDFEAYIWYSIAARNGEASAQAMKDKVAARLQPAEIRQAEHVIDRWTPRPAPGAASH